MPLRLAVFHPSIKDLRQIANGNGELETTVYVLEGRHPIPPCTRVMQHQIGLGRLALCFVSPLVFGLIYLVPARGAEPQFGIAVTGQETIRLAAQPHNARVYDLAFSPKPDSCVCAFAMEQVVQIWDLSAKPRVITTREVDQPLPKNLPRRGARKFMAQVPHPVSFSRDGSRLAMANDPYGVRVWDLATRRSSVVARPFWVPEVIRFTASGDGLIVGCSWRVRSISTDRSQASS